jgi:hypothetical protein
MTDMVKSEGVIIKTDEVGRVRTSAERREGLLDEFSLPQAHSPVIEGMTWAGVKTVSDVGSYVARFFCMFMLFISLITHRQESKVAK